jgi:predicted nucleotidyltransferase
LCIKGSLTGQAGRNAGFFFDYQSTQQLQPYISRHSTFLIAIEINVVFLFKQIQYMLDPEKNKVIIDYLQPFNPLKIGIFGSYARNESGPDSDLDILINLNTAISLFQLVRIERELTEILGVKVDLVSEGAIKNQKLRNYIEADLKIIFQS